MYKNIFPSGRLLKVVEKEGTSQKTSKTSSGKTFLFLQCIWRNLGEIGRIYRIELRDFKRLEMPELLNFRFPEG